ncbi:TPA: hypothetical protein DIU27_01630 [Candidatus Collierbacteria bacterium]|nr:MAG: hypothetical protein UW31_C0006G0100 [Candidatus Collierbacteria bacterium GW2011_GWA2_44_13]KKT61371.1 MAG: hypothetical protein UW56_C0027G0011 [Candidatus Collierbacteria bacterium GW2011_GWD1_44_27]KKT65332.1 MAG: hypothetical protein UW58_C0031G0016 [Candidatus Collierbacteria bacterium GW2011_GWC2_44_30]KKT88376.1 MAG: hypothetical protein UW88_C0011G0016 [Candidatus Collierbacteria bacterium GW2011_GWD2_45_10]HCQ31068.1 hypothetical protein [Candidatus Collierbacteria bacterium]
MLNTSELDSMLAEAFKDKYKTDPGFEKDVPPYLADFLVSNADNLKEAVLSRDAAGIKDLLRELTDKLPIDKKFRELFFTTFFSEDGKPRITCVQGDYGIIDADQTKRAGYGFGSLPGEPRSVKGILIIHTHPIDSKVGFSGHEDSKDVQVLAGNSPNSFSNMLKQFPSAEYAAVGLCTAGKRGKVLLVENKTVWGDKVIKADDLMAAAIDY